MALSIVGGIILAAGVLMLVFHKRWAPRLVRIARDRAVTPGARRAMGWSVYQVNARGYVPILLVGSAVGVVLGVILLLEGLGVLGT